MATFHALCVGINEAPGTIALPFSEADARKVHSRLAARGFDSTLLAGGGATTARWLAAVDSIAQRAEPEDQVVFYFSGHGREVPNDNQEPSFQKIIDEVDDDEVFRLWDGELLDDVLAAQVARLAGCQVLLIIDSCRAGGFRDVTFAHDPAQGGWVQLLAACAEDGTSWGHSAQGSYFTAALLQILDEAEQLETFDDWFQRALQVMTVHVGQKPRYFSSPQQPIRFQLGAAVPHLDLSRIQAHVLYGFSHLPQHWLCFFRVVDVALLARALERDAFALTSAERYRAVRGERARALALSYSGLSKLGAPNLDALGGTPGGAINAFRADCIGRSVALGDPVAGYGRSERWKVGGAYDEQRPDGVLIIAGADSPESLARDAEELMTGAGLELVFAEAGSWSADSREHFGFLDGLSKPGVGARPMSNERHPGFIPSSATSVHPIDTLLLTAPQHGLEWAADGSFLVYRRLVQDVEGFREAMDRYAAASGRRGHMDANRAAERVIGRRRDGSSLAISRRELQATGDQEAFDYSGGGCPAAAHVRKCNPRLSSQRVSELFGLEAFPVLYRRGVIFGPRSGDGHVPKGEHRQTQAQQLPQPALGTAAERGLHFMCYQASIERQYEFVIRQSINNPAFPLANSGVDALIGALPRTDPNAPRPVNLDGIPRPLAQFVTPTGGGYFFAPSLSGLRELARYIGGYAAEASAS